MSRELVFDYEQFQGECAASLRSLSGLRADCPRGPRRAWAGGPHTGDCAASGARRRVSGSCRSGSGDAAAACLTEPPTFLPRGTKAWWTAAATSWRQTGRASPASCKWCVPRASRRPALEAASLGPGPTQSSFACCRPRSPRAGRGRPRRATRLRCARGFPPRRRWDRTCGQPRAAARRHGARSGSAFSQCQDGVEAALAGWCCVFSATSLCPLGF